MARHCVVTGYSNGDFRLNRWHKDCCKVHNCLNSNPPCSCELPFQFSNGQKTSRIKTFVVQACQSPSHLIRATPVDTRAKIEDLFISFCGWGPNRRKPPAHLKPWLSKFWKKSAGNIG